MGEETSRAGPVEAVVFDVGGVLLDWDPRHLYRNVFTDEAAMEWFLGHVCTPQWHAPHDRGASTLDSCTRLAERHPDLADEIWAWARRSEEMVAGPVPGTVEVLRRLAAHGVACYALTNMEAETFPLRAARFDFFRLFSGVVVSGIERVAKPEPAIYEIVLHRYGLAPASTLFVDDNPDNLAPASALGMPVVLFESAARLEDSLAALGLLPGAPGVRREAK